MFASVIVDIPHKKVNQLFDYKVPDDIQPMLSPGHRVMVPFGKRTVQGYVMALKEYSDVDSRKVRAILKPLDIYPVLTQEMIELVPHIANYYIDHYISVIETMLPAALKSKYKKVLTAHDDEALNVLLSHQLSQHVEVKHVAPNLFKTLMPYIERGRITEDTHISQHTRVKTVMGVQVVNDEKTVDFNRATKQQELYALLLQFNEPIAIGHLKDEGFSHHIIKELLKKGLIEKVEIEVNRDPYSHREYVADEKKVLNDEQRHALFTIKDSMNDASSNTFLLHGVTGSGKTEIYIEAIEHALNKQQSAIVLVPEIALTPQMVNRFKQRFGNHIAVLHSGLSHGEKYDEWRKIKSGESQVAIGARSSVFAPFENLGVIIVDEEHETTYKQSDRPMYHAIDVAKVRAKYHQCPVILGSATPSLESYARAKKGVYQLLKLTQRAKTNMTPNVQVIDMANSMKSGERSIISKPLQKAIHTRISKGEQTILLLNRRGFSNFQICEACGHVPNCPNCDISLTYHKAHHTLLCHYCGYETYVSASCHNCESKEVTFRGIGTEQVEEILKDTFQVEVVRMDNDTTRKKGMHEKLLNQFEKERVPILLGTQMIAKGLDFRNVTLVGVLNSDTMLNLPDFRASERTFQLLSQVSGRAGRHDLPGEVILQTYNPEHYAIVDAAHNDYQSFFNREMQYRKVGRYAPYYYLVLFTIASESVQLCLEYSAHVHETLVSFINNQSIIVGPAPSPIERINRKYRFQILLKYKKEPQLHQVLSTLDDEFYTAYEEKGVSLKIDVDPFIIM